MVNKGVIVFLDIETVSEYETYDMLSDRFKALWDRKSSYLKRENPYEAYQNCAVIYAEFSKVITLALGIHYDNDNQEKCFRVRAITSHNEKELLQDFAFLLKEKFSGKKIVFCAHNGKEFDYPFLCRRFLINGLPLPDCLDVSGKKPWEVPHLDTLEMWKFGDYKSYCSLETLATVFDVPTSKNGIDGSQVRNVYYEEKDLSKIEYYCQDDVIVTSQVYLKLKGEECIPENRIFRVE